MTSHRFARACRMNAAAAAVAALAAVSATACDGPTAPSTPEDATGFWSGDATPITISTRFGTRFSRADRTGLDPRIFGERSTLEFVLNEFDDRTLFGTGTVHTPERSIAITIKGNNIFPVISFSIRAIGFQDINFLGRWIGRDLVRGRLNGSGFDDVLIRFRRRTRAVALDRPPI